MEYLEESDLDTAPYRSAVWLRYVNDTFDVWSHDTEKLQEVREIWGSHDCENVGI
jgi:hypothetical protein